MMNEQARGTDMGANDCLCGEADARKAGGSIMTFEDLVSRLPLWNMVCE
jgi:hypothetical protein